jgi:hypothetical protein
MASLDSGIRNLLKVISQIQNVSSIGGMDFMKSSKPYWHICTEKFHAAYIKAKNPEGFRDMFLSFFEKNLKKFSDDVIDDDGDINDEWLKNKDILTTKMNKKKKTIDESSFSLRNINCRGEVIYFDETNEKIKNVSIPISEAYLSACKIYSDGAKRGEYSPLPAQLLVALFTLMSEVCDEQYKEQMEKNVKALKDVVEQLTNGEDTNNGMGSTLNGIGGLLEQAKKKLGLDLNNLDSGNIEKTVSGLFSDDITSKAKSIWDKFNSKVNASDAKDISSIISSVSDAMKDGELQAELQSTLAEVASKVGFGGINISKEDQDKITPENTNVNEQE